ncbi:molybdopterin-dependent oxidoreductase [Tautonia sociabilis]|uniref:2Fe-2S iron-sulfur cluster binding domain-containing protein n=1 Tax=Tautonia sociabilis TaxID=2080755 RepID=A0A432MLS1_9BACT|nr:molybdopterin-dependent oxidoreductase [Tautonia sociabilis]RUL88374.1 2Fe-2S iron-sulfur cluster binding domain-containing protein [Tautonia sociabilis]
MATIIINGTEYTLPEGERLNAIQAAQRFGVEIPYYCWHPALSVVANCRMCEIQVGSKDPKTGEIKMIPKMVPGCQTPAKDGTVIVTDSPEVRSHQAMIMEYLLINHPLDCPVCDQAGQCGLQDYSYRHGQAIHRFVEERTVNPRKDVSDQIQLNMDRCIMCTRCVRFCREITRTNELQVERRGNHAEITIFPDRPLDNPMAGNVVDLCPVGALLDKDFLHKQRYWFNDQHSSVCTRCSTGCNIVAEENRGQIWRLRARYNPKVNDYWICDEGRSSYKSANDANLLPAMYLREGGQPREAPVDRALDTARTRLKEIARQGGTIAAVISPFLTVEEAYLLASYIKGLSGEAVLALGPVPVVGEDQTFAPDQRQGRTGDTSFVVPRPFTIRAEKCPNRNGVERILKHFQGEVIPIDRLRERAASTPFDALYITGGGHEPAYEGQEWTKLRDGAKFLVVQDVWPTDLAGTADVILSSATFAEKAGCYVNATGRLQYASAALPPRDGSLPDLDILAILAERPGGGPISSRDVLSELAGQVPAFAAVRSLDGPFPEFGLPLDGSEEPTPGMFRYVDPWHAPRGRVSLAT